jgi:hypothetical protein
MKRPTFFVTILALLALLVPISAVGCKYKDVSQQRQLNISLTIVYS